MRVSAQLVAPFGTSPTAALSSARSLRPPARRRLRANGVVAHSGAAEATQRDAHRPGVDVRRDHPPASPSGPVAAGGAVGSEHGSHVSPMAWTRWCRSRKFGMWLHRPMCRPTPRADPTSSPCSTGGRRPATARCRAASPRDAPRRQRRRPAAGVATSAGASPRRGVVGQSGDRHASARRAARRGTADLDAGQRHVRRRTVSADADRHPRRRAPAHWSRDRSRHREPAGPLPPPGGRRGHDAAQRRRWRTGGQCLRAAGDAPGGRRPLHVGPAVGHAARHTGRRDPHHLRRPPGDRLARGQPRRRVAGRSPSPRSTIRASSTSSTVSKPGRRRCAPIAPACCRSRWRT